MFYFKFCFIWQGSAGSFVQPCFLGYSSAGSFVQPYFLGFSSAGSFVQPYFMFAWEWGAKWINYVPGVRCMGNTYRCTSNFGLGTMVDANITQRNRSPPLRVL